MNDKITFPGGEPNMKENDFLIKQQANRDFINAFLGDMDGDPAIITGIVADPWTPGNPLIITQGGYIFLNDEVIQVDAGTYSNVRSNAFWIFVKITTYDPFGDKTFQNGIPRQTRPIYRAEPINVASVGSGDLDVLNGFRWNQIGPWENVNINVGIFEDYPLSTMKIRHYKGYIELFGYIDGRGSPGSGSWIFEIPVGYRDFLPDPTIFQMNYDSGLGTSDGVIRLFYVDTANNYKVRYLDNDSISDVDLWHINVRIPYYNKPVL
jgi:hypothetical protein